MLHGGYVEEIIWINDTGDEFGMYVPRKYKYKRTNCTTNRNNAQRTISYLQLLLKWCIGVGKLSNGESHIHSKKHSKNLVSNQVEQLILPLLLLETSSVYISRNTNDGFYVKEIQTGRSNASLIGRQIGTRKGYENGIISDTVYLIILQQKHEWSYE